MRSLEEKNISYKLRQQRSKQYTAEGVALDLGVPVAQVIKAMLIERSNSRAGGPRSPFALFVLPGDRRLSLKKVGAELNDKQVRLATERDVERITGYQIGAVSVVGFRRAGLPNFIDQAVLELDQIVISSGRPDLGLVLLPGDMLKALGGAQIGDYCSDK